MKQTKILTDVTHVNGWFPAVYMSYIGQSFRLFHVSNLSVNFQIFLLMYPRSMTQPLPDGQSHARLAAGKPGGGSSATGGQDKQRSKLARHRILGAPRRPPATHAPGGRQVFRCPSSPHTSSDINHKHSLAFSQQCTQPHTAAIKTGKFGN